MELKATLVSSGEVGGMVSLARGADGKTPVKGVDYFTAEDISDIINATLGAEKFDTAVRSVRPNVVELSDLDIDITCEANTILQQTLLHPKH